MADITIIQWTMIYLIGFMITLSILKWIYSDDMHSYNDVRYITAFSIVWPIILLLLILGTLIWLIYKFCNWFLEL
jgi:hypothetical protein